jgi:hypothetical protein
LALHANVVGDVVELSEGLLEDISRCNAGCSCLRLLEKA